MEPHRSGRLSRLTPPGLDPEQMLVYDEIANGRRASGGGFPLREADGSLVGPFNTMLVAPHVGLHLQRLGSAIRYETSLPASGRELAILLCARATRSEFEWYAHAPLALAAGVPPSVVESLRTGGSVVLDDPVDRAVVDVATHILASGDVPDPVYKAASTVLTDVQLVEVAVLVGYYRLLSGLLQVFRVPLPDGTHPSFGDEGGNEGRTV